MPDSPNVNKQKIALDSVLGGLAPIAPFLRKAWRLAQVLAVFASILALILSLTTIRRVGQLQTMLTVLENWDLSIGLVEPADGSCFEGHLVRVGGVVNFETRPSTGIESIRLRLASEEVALVPMVRPESEPLLWWPQPPPRIDDEGAFSGLVRLGDPDVGDGVTFELVMLATPGRAAERMSPDEHLPQSYAQSRAVSVTRGC